jgi:predicted nucleic acid-binding protein
LNKTIPLTLSELPAGEAVFIDANIFVYHFTGVSAECRGFLERCERAEVSGVTSVLVLAEVCHRLMAAEALSKRLISPQKPSLQLQKKPDVVRQLSLYALHLAAVRQWGIRILPAPEDAVEKSQIFRTQYGLLTNDSLILAAMNAASLRNLASRDQAFARVPSLRLYSPTDIG